MATLRQVLFCLSGGHDFHDLDDAHRRCRHCGYVKHQAVIVPRARSGRF